MRKNISFKTTLCLFISIFGAWSISGASQEDRHLSDGLTKVLIELLDSSTHLTRLEGDYEGLTIKKKKCFVNIYLLDDDKFQFHVSSTTFDFKYPSQISKNRLKSLFIEDTIFRIKEDKNFSASVFNVTLYASDIELPKKSESITFFWREGLLSAVHYNQRIQGQISPNNIFCSGLKRL